MYIKLKDFTGKLNKEDVLLMSHDEFVEGGKEKEVCPSNRINFRSGSSYKTNKRNFCVSNIYLCIPKTQKILY